MGIIAVIGAAMFGAFLGFVTYMILDRRCYLTDDDYKIINSKFEDVWKDVCGLKHRVRELEDAENERTSLVDATELRPGDSVAAWDSAKKQWRSGHVNELYGLMALVVTDDGACLMASKARRL